MINSFEYMRQSETIKIRAIVVIGGVILIFLLLAIGAWSRSYHAGNKIQKLEHRLDSTKSQVHRLEKARDSLLSVVRRTEGGLARGTREDVLWTTRALLSETKRPSEMLHVATVIRNRMDRGYRGSGSAQEVVLDRYQFSGFNPGRAKRLFYMGLTRKGPHDYLWDVAWNVSRYAMTMPRRALPLGPCVTHFFHVTTNEARPSWPLRMKQVNLGDVHLPRIKFYRPDRRCNG